MSRRIVVLTAAEIEALDQQDPSTAGDGGFQGFIVGLQKKLRRGTSEIILTDDDQENIAHYAFDFKQGGWQTRQSGSNGRQGPLLAGLAWQYHHRGRGVFL